MSGDGQTLGSKHGKATMGQGMLWVAGHALTGEGGTKGGCCGCQPPGQNSDQNHPLMKQLLFLLSICEAIRVELTDKRLPLFTKPPSSSLLYNTRKTVVVAGCRSSGVGVGGC